MSKAKRSIRCMAPVMDGTCDGPVESKALKSYRFGLTQYVFGYHARKFPACCLSQCR